MVLGIRPDVIRAAIILRLLRAHRDVDLQFIWSGQHYSDNLKDIFFRELGVAPADHELGVTGESDAEVSAGVIARLYPLLESLRPEAVVFLGDTNTVIGCVAAAQLNIPVVHIEGCMRSYDWRMPEEKYRTVSDHLSDRIYAYLDEYKAQGVAEGLNPGRISVVGNPIVDVLREFYSDRQDYYDRIASGDWFAGRGIARGEFLLMTCHRRENVGERGPLERVLALAGVAGRTVYFPASYRTQRMITGFGLQIPANVRVVDPVGYDEFLTLLTHSRGTLTDSGTVVEEACVLGVPSVQMRRSTERPQVYDVGASIKFDPGAPHAARGANEGIIERLSTLALRPWKHPFGDGHSSQRIVDDLVERLLGSGLGSHQPADYHVPIARSFRGDAA